MRAHQRVPWVAMGRKLKQLAVLPKRTTANSTESGAGRHGLDKNQPAFLQWTRAVEKE